MWILIIQRIFFEAVLDFFYFPLWWYSGGLVQALKWCFNLFLSGNDSLLPFVWLKNLFVPMYGQYDWQGRIISFLMRFVQFVFRSLALSVWVMICFLFFCVWLLIPVVVSYGFIKSFLR